MLLVTCIWPRCSHLHGTTDIRNRYLEDVRVINLSGIFDVAIAKSFKVNVKYVSFDFDFHLFLTGRLFAISVAAGLGSFSTFDFPFVAVIDPPSLVSVQTAKSPYLLL